MADREMVTAEDSYAFYAIRHAFGEGLAREFLLIDYHLEHGQPGRADVVRDGLDLIQSDRFNTELELASGSRPY